MGLEFGVNFSSNMLHIGILDRERDYTLSMSRTMNGAQACEILNWIERALQEHQIDFRKDIKFWTLGIGPGSFSALRIAAALFAGLTFQRSDFFVRSIPSITAIFDSMPDNAENPAVLFDGRRNEIFCFSSPEQREPDIVKEPNEIDKFDYVYALREHETAIQSFFKDKSAEITMLEEFPIIKLLENKKEYTAVESIDYFYEDLIYLRPPV